MLEARHTGLVILLLWLAISESHGAGSCPSGWTLSSSSGICIKFVDVKKTWQDARTACQQEGADLVKITDDSTNQLIADYVSRHAPNTPYWIGLHDQTADGLFVWLDETREATWTKWAQQQPNSLSAGQDCVEIGLVSPNEWNDIGCSITARYICGKSLGSTDITGSCPSGWTLSSSSGTCIKFVDVEKTWQDARTACQQEGADLVKITDDSTNQLIADYVSKHAPNTPYWIGLHDQTADGLFVWLDETREATWTKWAQQQPNSLSAGQDCVEIGLVSPNEWNDIGCSLTARYICGKSLGSTDSTGLCPSGWTLSSSSGTCIKFVDVEKTWQDARTACQQEGADLVKITDDSTNQLIADYVSKHAPNTPYWIGLHDQTADGLFVWLDETREATWTKWAQQQPNSLSAGQDCVEIGLVSPNEWNDIGCSLTARYICGKSLGSTDSTGLCPSGWTLSSSSGTCIKFVDVEKTWQDARTACQQEGADLVKITDDSTNQLIADYVSKHAPNTPYWIGLHDQTADGLFVWLDETREATWTKWAQQQPNSLSAGQDCVEIGLVSPNEWNDIGCSLTARYICGKSLGSTDSTGSCPSGWTLSSSSGTCIKFVDVEKTWKDARTACQQEGADLVKITDDSTNQLIADYVSKHAPNTPYWIGLHDQTADGLFVWLDETREATWTKWAQQQPNSLSAGQDCVEIGLVSPNEWNDIGCSLTARYICGKSLGSTDSTGSCPSGWTLSSSSGTCIKFVDVEKTWKDARTACQQEGADLVKITDDSTNQLIADYVSKHAPNTPYWIGLHDQTADGLFVWLDETREATWTKWAQQQPNSLSAGQDCVEIGLVSPNEWNDIGCSLRARYICGKSLGSTDSTGSCPSGWTLSSSSGTCIKFVDVEKTWKDARTACQQEGADLVKITDDSTNQLIADYVSKHAPNTPYWIGLHDQTADGLFVWLDETREATWTKWAQQQPNSLSAGQDCVEIGLVSPNEWNDIGCSLTARYICGKSLGSTDSTGSCPSGWTLSSSSGTCIKFVDVEKTWQDARTACQQEGADLVKITDDSTNQLIADYVSKHAPNTPYWIGLHDQTADGLFVWLDETREATWTKWAQQQPNSLSAGQDCVEIGLVSPNEWNDIGCSLTARYICGKSLGSTGSTGSCPSGWTLSSSSGTCIKFVDVEKTWQDARTACQQEGADLVKITDDSTNQLIADYVSKHAPNTPYWIGLHDPTADGLFVWLDETREATWTKWAEHQPNSLSAVQDCAEIGLVSPNEWNDIWCSLRARYICGKSLGSTDITVTTKRTPITTSQPSPLTTTSSYKITTYQSTKSIYHQESKDTSARGVSNATVATIVGMIVFLPVALVVAYVIGRHYFKPKQRMAEGHAFENVNFDFTLDTVKTHNNETAPDEGEQLPDGHFENSGYDAGV